MQTLIPTQLGEAIHVSPLPHALPHGVRVPAQIQWQGEQPPPDLILFEKAGPRRKSVLRSGAHARGHRHLRRPVPRLEQCDPLGDARAAAQLRRAQRAGHPRRLPRARPCARACADRAERGAGRGHPQRRRHDARHLARPGGHEYRGRLPDGATHRPAVHRGRRRHAARRPGAVRGGPPARLCAGRGGHPEDHRQRRALRLPNLRLWHRRRRGGARDRKRAHRGALRRARRVAGQADGPACRLHRRRSHRGQCRRQLLPGAGGALLRSTARAACWLRCSGGCSAGAMW